MNKPKMKRTSGVKPIVEYRINWIDEGGDIIDCDHYDTESAAWSAAIRPYDDAVRWEIEKVKRVCYTDPLDGSQSWDIDSEVAIKQGEYAEAAKAGRLS